MDLKAFTQAIDQIAEEKGIAKEKVIETIEMAIAAAYKKDYGKRGQIVRAKLDSETGKTRIFQIKIVVDESMIKSEEEVEAEKERGFIPEEPEGKEETEKIRFNPEKHVMRDEARKTDKKLKSGDEMVTELETHEDFGRIAAQTAKQVIIQRIREAEREAIFSEFNSREGELVSGIVQRQEGRTVFFDLGKAIGIMPPLEQISGEAYRVGLRLKCFLMKVEDTPKGPVIYLSRAHPKMISRLFEIEVPEVAAGTVVIKSIAREAGARSKVAVESREEGVDPIGSCVGQKGTRVMTIIGELGGEKIDIIKWEEDAEKFIANALAPAKVLTVEIDRNRNQAIVYVPEDQLSLAIGKAGQNVRLAAKLTGWKIDVRSGKGEKESLEAETGETTTDKKESKEKEHTKPKKKPSKKIKTEKQEKEPSNIETPKEVGVSDEPPSRENV